jgi:serine/threonine-protein kinase RsbW
MAIASDTLSLPSRLSEIERARSWARGHAQAAGFGDDDAWAVELALAEALSNVIRHGYEGDPGQRIDLSIEVDADTFCVRVQDYGQVFDPHTIVPTDFETPGPGGYGLHLIEELMDEVKRDTSSGRGTVLRLVKHRPRSGR